ncbi:hypothetical protein PhaeoP66_04685 (plasmid) [Phaeobacter inhibens]|uniref:Uncharacterized protein n=1 Tax=Phaeobacter inhibens TaxID=221822 RepID=A0ABN5GYU2_9RHOB|nr:hypothetical protein [Phaeobacter inhibens]AUQ93846.1 hypothetical protein PhaeoP66_01042 [Phaeobacter inhibens]AUQ97411.1 hypothetical protein PhaeoP66_04685 [Phaeobacter inhibens]
MLDLQSCALAFPDRPDWVWLRWYWGVTDLLRDGVTLDDVAARERGRIACLATPYSDFPGGPVLAADYAAEWAGLLCGAGLLPLSPALSAFEAGAASAEVGSVSRVAEFVVVPPIEGWRQSVEVWRAVCTGLAAMQPVYLLNGGA